VRHLRPFVGCGGRRALPIRRAMALDVSIWAAFLAGIISFLSPCVLPLVPPYLCFITGASLNDLTERGDTKWQAPLAALLFVLGFSTVFVLLGASASWAGQLLREHLALLGQIAGAVIILMGLHFLGAFRIGFLNRDIRYRQEARPASLLGAYLVGLAFAFGWTPCISPVLGTILAVAAGQDTVAKGALLLAVYSLGLGIPFLIAALAVGSFLGFFRRFSGHLGTVEKVMGGALVVTGVMFLTGTIQNVSYWIQETFPSLNALG
jgi:cytochrome c-type biogenesis protein